MNIKKITALLLSMVMVLSLCACGAESATSEETKALDKTENSEDVATDVVEAEDSIDNIIDEAESLAQSGDYEEALSLIEDCDEYKTCEEYEDLKAKHDEIKEEYDLKYNIEEIEITAENWEQYFELKEIKGKGTDEYGHKVVTLNNILMPKEEYIDKIATEYDFEIILKNQTRYMGSSKIKYDEETEEITVLSTDSARGEPYYSYGVVHNDDFIDIDERIDENIYTKEDDYPLLNFTTITKYEYVNADKDYTQMGVYDNKIIDAEGTLLLWK